MPELRKEGKFLWIGNSPALDFINTVIAVEGSPVDLLADAGDFVLWLHESGLCEGWRGRAPAATEHLLGPVRAYRSLVRVGMARLSAQEPAPPALLTQTNTYLRRDVSWPEVEQAGRVWRLRRRWRFDEPQDLIVPVARAVAEFVATADPQRLRKCRNPDCVLFYYDTSKGGQRSWCSLGLCGNRLRMAASRERRRLQAFST